jgi:hypothetical protein
MTGPYPATAVPAARARGWTHWGPDRCPLCGRGLSARLRGVQHARRGHRRALRHMSAAYRASLPLCPFVVQEDAS